MERGVHPDNLPWFVSGAIEPTEAEGIRAHLEVCAECRVQADTLASLRDTLVRHRDTPHLPAAELVAHSRGELAGERRNRAEAHLAACPSCRLDLDEARQGIVSRRAGSAPSRPHLRSRWILAASLIVAGLGGALLWSLSRPESRTITLLPSHRDTANPAALTGRGPWNLNVALPFESPDGEYLLRVEKEDRSTVAGIAPSATRRSDGTVLVKVPELPGPGRYRIVLTPPVAAIGAPYEYTFDLVDDRSEAP